MIAEIIESKPWENRIATQDSASAKLIKANKGTFDKYQQSLLGMFSQITEVEKPYKSIMQLPMMDDQVTLFAILVQNALHPKNKQRTEAITSGTYCEIKSKVNAEEFLGAILKQNLENEFRGVESEV